MDKKYLCIRVVNSDIAICASKDMRDVVDEYFDFYEIKCRVIEYGFLIDDKEKFRQRWIEICEYEHKISNYELYTIQNNDLYRFDSLDFELFWKGVSDAFEINWPHIVECFNETTS